jgi:signal transduction histidine kinase
MLGSTAESLLGQNLLQRVADETDQRETLEKLLIDRVKIEREITVRGNRPRRCILRISGVSSQEDSDSPVLGLVASLSDVTRQHELHQTKNDVIALVSHEMRTPLTAIQGMTELLAAYDLDPERRREMNLAINDEVKRLTRMITEYLDITRLEAGATTVRNSPVRMETLVERALLLLEPVAARRQIRLVRRLGKDLPPLLADADLLSRAVDNLVSNAIKYSPPGKEVTVTARSGDGSVVIEVADQGYGIPPEDLDRIFNKFYRVPRVQDADTPGTGLGLAFVKEIAELHGGSVIVRSEVTAGSVFTLRIPGDTLH